jgi:hypothetical protein
MLMNFGHEPQIENLRQHSTEAVEKLQNLLAGAVDVTPDPKRKGFYELKAGSTVYYIDISPVTGTVFFLATWENPRRSYPCSVALVSRVVELSVCASG